MTWKKIGTYGDQKYDRWTTSYYISYSVDGSTWVDYKDKQIFSGNVNRGSLVEYLFEPFNATSIRIHPQSWYNEICLRMEVYCSEI